MVRGKKFQTVAIGSEINMKAAAAARYQQLSAVSLCKFLSGYGLNEVNSAEAIWTKETLAKVSSKMTLQLIGILLCGVMALYLAASTVEVHLRQTPDTSVQKRSQ